MMEGRGWELYNTEQESSSEEFKLQLVTGSLVVTKTALTNDLAWLKPPLAG
jgi:hypothetical protein